MYTSVFTCVHLCSPCIRVFCVHSDSEHKVYTVVYNGGEASCGPHLGWTSRLTRSKSDQFHFRKSAPGEHVNALRTL